MEKSARIYVAGHRGLAGSAIVRRLRAAGFDNLLLRTHAELELTDAAAVERFFRAERPEYVVLAAAKVGGILANDTFPAEFIRENLAIQTNILHEAWRAGVKRLLFLGSSCIYPRDCPQPMKEEYLLTGPLEPTNRPYAIAKIAGIEMCSAYNRQYGTRFLAVMPTNLYGPGDNYDLQTSHVLPALIRKAHEAKARGEEALVVWGTGKPRREFLYSDDMADACVALLRLEDEKFGEAIGTYPPLVNIGAGEDLTIRELAELVCEVVGFEGRLAFDASKPDGMPRKLLDTSRMGRLGWRARIGLREGIAMAYEDFCRVQ
ncbi:MAG: GDP-L-fucose synthase family protein [Burkholderiales bacterium]